jgi:hypothetical protein
MNIKLKRCVGTGKAKGYGCGSMQLVRKYGLGLNCGCYKKWLLTTPEGLQTIHKTAKTAHKKEIIKTRKEEKEKKEEFTDYSRLLQDKINEIVRFIDVGLPCLARRYHPKQIHAGHIYSRGSNSSMRYNLHNIHRQSAQSNHFQNEDGLLREGLKREYGEEYFEFLSNLRQIPALKYSNEEYKAFYKKACEIALRLKREGNVFNLEQRIEKRNEINIEIGIYPVGFCVFKHT